jgi:nucleoside-diphosphate-sugar epimerase
MLGGWVVRRLSELGRPVTGVDLRPTPGGTVADVRDRQAMGRALAGARAVVHCAAALPSYPAEQIESVIVAGTRTVLAAARDAGVERVVHISSTAVYGLPGVVPTTEEYPREPVDAYGAAKAAAEQDCERYRAGGWCVPVLRPKTFLGPGRMGLFAMLFEWASDARHFPILGRGEARIQMCAVADLIDCVITVLDADPGIANDTFNVAAARFGTLREDFQAVLDAAGHGKRVISIPIWPTLPTLRLLQRLHLSPVYGRLLHKLLADSYVSIDKAHDRLGFTPRYSNQDALLETYHWWQDQPHHHATATGGGRTSREPWSQGALRAAKVFF